VTLEIRRVVTGHDDQGRSIVLSDQVVSGEYSRPGTTRRVLWTTEGFPVDNDGDEDTADREVGTTLPNGTVFRVVQWEPGNGPRMHRTDSIDYALVLSGEVDMELDDTTVHLKAGDALVQRGTVHNWVNNGTEPCRIAFILVDARPVTVNGQPLPAHG
jgi:quercetin dioxygenase-like cupin family protein